ncbi:MAG: hypothetical protein F9K30_22180 [Dechloromonas sp.]|nr:MAG: hypothetical protein F9K30_22180 [Dechloromonas sp.]
MKTRLFRLFLLFCSAILTTGRSFAADKATEAIIVVRLGPFCQKGEQIGLPPNQRYFDLIECEILSPQELKLIRPWVDLALVPSPANERFKKEKGRYAKLLLCESNLKELLRAGLSIYVPTSLPTSDTITALGAATPASMHEPPSDKGPNESPQRNAGSSSSSGNSSESETLPSLDPRR